MTADWDRTLMKLGLTHDLACVLEELTSAARRYALPRLLSSQRPVLDDLAVAAVAFVIQLAVDTTDRDPGEMRALERKLIAVLGAAERDEGNAR